MAEVVPIVRRKLKDERIITREGRGFSLNELKEAGITVDLAKKLGIRIDKRRRSCRPENVEMLKEFLRNVSKKPGEGS
ncbi:MAG: ribosomal protein L13e [Thaumarchaeota archaeon]|nr:ribosomal protein L13e [Nitrososphaerota archaeon]